MQIGLVLGAGGIAGYAYHSGVLAGLTRVTGWDARTSSVVVGTSAGAGVGALVRAGIPAPDLAAVGRGDPVSPEGTAALERLFGTAAPQRGRTADAFRQGVAQRTVRMASPGAAVRQLARVGRTRWGTVLAGLLPEGRVSIEDMTGAFSAMRWPEHPLWLCAVRLRDGRRVVFGRDREAPASVGAAVAASSAIPGVFAPVRIGQDRFVDGGAHSPTNLDVLAGRDLDLIVVSSPMTMRRQAPVRVDLAARVFAKRTLARERARLRRDGTPVLVLEPGAADLRAMGPNPMDPSRVEAISRRAEASVVAAAQHPRVRERLDVLVAAS